MLKSTILMFIVVFCSYAYGQSIQRQSIGTIGSSHSSEGTTIQQSVGQPYGTQSYYSNEIESRPGFIQPTQFTIDLIQTTFDVQVDVYPNPSTATVFFKLNENLENVVLYVVDQSGKMVYTESIVSMREYQLDCSQWQSGSYFIYLKDSSGKNYQSKLIKQ